MLLRYSETLVKSPESGQKSVHIVML